MTFTMADQSLPLPPQQQQQQQPLALPQSQLFSMQGAMKSAVQAASGNGAKGTTRVLLRVKRRRPSPTTAAARSANNTVADNAVGAIAPDRIKLALPCMPSAPPPHAEGSTKKRRKLDKKEELALIQRLDSAASIHNNELAKKDNGGATATGDNNGMCRTPPRKSPHKNLYNPITDMMGGLADGQRTPPSATTINASNNTNHNNDTTPTPAPPTKPKRTVMFRKITDLQKRLDAAAAPNESQNGEHAAQLSSATLFSNSNPQEHDNNNNDNTSTQPTGETEWESMGEEKSKWLRVVDVMLKEDDQVSSICSNDNDGAAENVSKPEGILGSGQRVRRMRPRPLDIDNNNGDTAAAGAASNSGGRNAKRRKLGWVVEQSRTVLESDFWNNTLNQSTAANTSSSSSSSDKLDPEKLRLIEYSLAALHQQGGGSVAPHLSFLKNDPRLGLVANTPTSKMMVNHALNGTSLAGVVSGSGSRAEEGKGRTVIHIAALWGDLSGVRMALETGADPTLFDAQGGTPAGLARKGGHNDVVSALIEGEKRAIDDKNINSDGNGGEYYYEVYCLETDGNNSELGKVSNSAQEKMDDTKMTLEKKQFLATSTVNTEDIPDLERSSVLSDDDDLSSGYNNRNCALIELQKGFGYWNERGELILDAAAGDDSKRGVNGGGDNGKSSSAEDARFVQKFYHDGNMDGDDSMEGNEEEHDSNDEGYGGNDYPEDVSFGLDSDYEDYRDADHAYGEAGSCCSDDSVDNWKMDFRNRFVTKNELNICDYASDGDEDERVGPMHGEEKMDDDEKEKNAIAYDPNAND